MEGLCCIKGLVRSPEHLCAAVNVRVVGLPQYQEHEIGCQRCAGALGLGRPRLRPSLVMHIYVHAHICISFVCRNDAGAMAQKLPSTPHPDFLDMRRAF